MTLCRPVYASTPTPAEQREARRWVAATLTGEPLPDPTPPFLEVLANNDPVQLNARNGRPLAIGGQQFWRGLYCHAVSRIRVHLPGAGKTFQASVGVDSNEQTTSGRGSVTFAVSAAERELWRSELLRESTGPVPVQVDLGGATEFLLDVGDGGDGIGCDQADWAEARALLADGSILWLGDLPVVQPGYRTYAATAPFSFFCDGRPSSEFLAGWTVTESRERLDDRRSRQTRTYTDPASGIEARWVAVVYDDYPTVEWVLHLRNGGQAPTPVISDIRPLDLRLSRFPWPSADWSEFRLHHHTGSPCTPADYQPFQTRVRPGQVVSFAPPGGRPSDSVLPYFNLEYPTSEGLILAIGWPGQWAARFERDQETGLRVLAGQELTRLRLQPGEEVRTPLIVLQFWVGDRVHAQNVWRRWMLRYGLPQVNGSPPPNHMAACSSHQFAEMINANTENQKFFVDRYLEEKLPLDYWWMDAGWYVNRSGWPNTGTWEVDTERFPGGLKVITDHADTKGVRSIVWFEPERVTPGTWLYDTHPEWLLGADGGTKLLDLGNPQARQWLTDHVDRLITEQGIDLYRNDFNIDPLPFWRARDTEDRQGLTEIRYVEGFLAWWDELRRRHPGMLIDTCASGGRRNDLETLRRSVPLLRSDYILEPVSQQLHTYGIASWIPMYGTGVNSADPYVFRSQQCPFVTACYDLRRRDYDYESVRRLLVQWQRTAPCYLGDYYPLTPYSTETGSWMAWQFDRPEKGDGVVQVFRRQDSIYEAAHLPLRGLDPGATYRLDDVDGGEARVLSGRELAEAGLPVSVPRRAMALVIHYQRQ
jgi:alpha-galactosidase